MPHPGVPAVLEVIDPPSSATLQTVETVVSNNFASAKTTVTEEEEPDLDLHFLDFALGLYALKFRPLRFNHRTYHRGSGISDSAVNLSCGGNRRQ